jgi:hypothetical protein
VYIYSRSLERQKGGREREETEKYTQKEKEKKKREPFWR